MATRLVALLVVAWSVSAGVAALAAAQVPSAFDVHVRVGVPVGEAVRLLADAPAPDAGAAAAVAARACGGVCDGPVEVAPGVAVLALEDPWLEVRLPVGTNAHHAVFPEALLRWLVTTNTVAPQHLLEQGLTQAYVGLENPPAGPVPLGSTEVRLGPPAPVREVLATRVHADGRPAWSLLSERLSGADAPAVPAPGEDPEVRIDHELPIPSVSAPAVAGPAAPPLAPPTLPGPAPPLFDVTGPASAADVAHEGFAGGARGETDASAEDAGPPPVARDAPGAASTPIPGAAMTAALQTSASPARDIAAAPAQAAIAAVLVSSALTLPAWVLYRRVRRERALDQPVRRDLLARIAASPGITPGRLSADAGLHYTTCQHHLRLLEELGFIDVRRLGGRLRCFERAPWLGAREARLLAARRSTRARAVLDAVDAAPGRSPAAVARAIGASRSGVHFHVRRLVAWGLVVEQREGARVRLHPADAAPPRAPPGVAPAAPRISS